jgi:thioesterase domain-containing protein
VGIHDNFFELGGHSLLSIRIIDRVNHAGLWLAPGNFFQHQTIAEMAAAITLNRPAESKGAEWSSLVTLQPHGTKPPFFLIHTSPGDVLGYMKLVHHLGSDQPCYGFQSLGLFSREACHASLEEMAAHYVKLLRQFQPEGPYHLGGWCFGADVALEIGQQLVQQGQAVALLVLLETWAHHPPWTCHRYYWDRFKWFVRWCPKRLVPNLLAKARRRLKRERPVMEDAANKFAFEMIQSGPLANREMVHQINRLASRKYKSRYYPGRITLIRSTSTSDRDYLDPAAGFSTLAAELEIHVIPGEHRAVIQEPKVRFLAETLKTCLNRAQASSQKGK